MCISRNVRSTLIRIRRLLGIKMVADHRIELWTQGFSAHLSTETASGSHLLRIGYQKITFFTILCHYILGFMTFIYLLYKYDVHLAVNTNY